MLKQGFTELPKHIVDSVENFKPSDDDECMANVRAASTTSSTPAERVEADLTGVESVPMKQRLAAVEQMIRDCWSHREIELECVARWNIMPRMARSYIKRVYDELKFVTSKHREREYEQIKGTFTEIAKRAMKEGDFRAAAYANREKANLIGLNVERVQISANVNSVAHHLSLDDASNRIGEAAALVQLAKKRSLALEAHKEPSKSEPGADIIDGEFVEQ